MSKQTQKKRKTNFGESSSRQPIEEDDIGYPLVNNPVVSRGGKEGIRERKKILDGYVYVKEKLEDANFWRYIKNQNWEDFVGLSENIYPNWVHFFYSHVSFNFSENGKSVKIELTFDNNETLSYSTIDFFHDFGVSYHGFNKYIGDDWPIDVFPSYEEVCVQLTNDNFENWDERGDKPFGPWIQLFTGDDRLLTNCINRCILPIGTQERKITKPTLALLYLVKQNKPINLPILIAHHMKHVLQNKKATSLPFGMLITHIMKKWRFGRFLSKGNPTTPILQIEDSFVKQWVILGDDGKAYCEWEIKQAPSEICDYLREKVSLLRWNQILGIKTDKKKKKNGGNNENDNQGNNVALGVENEEVEEEPLRRRRNVPQNDVNARLGNLENKVKKQGKWLKGIMKFLKCFGREQGASSEALGHLDFSDSEVEEEPRNVHRASSSHPEHNDDDDDMFDPNTLGGFDMVPYIPSGGD